MLTLLNELEDNLLINELQLGVKLNECVHSERRSDFSLMLAMLVDDVREHAQFTLPENEIVSQDESEQQLRKNFHLPDKMALSAKDFSNLNRYNQADLLNDTRLMNIHLDNALNPIPLTKYDDVKRIPQEVLSNTSLYCQKRHKNNEKPLSDKLLFNAKAWLDGIQTSIVKAPLVSL